MGWITLQQKEYCTDGIMVAPNFECLEAGPKIDVKF
jgi:hypothetical protein